MKNTRARSTLLYVATCLLWVSIYVYTPIFSPYCEAMGANYSLVGAILSSYGLTQMICRIPVGMLSDILGKRKPFIIAGMMLGTLSSAGMYFATTPEWMLVLRAIAGLCAATWATYITLYNSYYSAEQQAGSMGTINSAMYFGQMAATFAGGLIAQYISERLTFAVAAACGVVGMLICLFVVEPPAEKKRTVRARDLLRLLKNKDLLFYSAEGMLMQLAIYTGAFGFIPNILRELGANNFVLGLATTVGSITAIVSSFLSGGFFKRVLGTRCSLVSGMVVLALTLFGTVMTRSIAFILALLGVCGFAKGILQPMLTQMAVRAVEPELKSTAVSFFQSVYGIGQTMGPIIAGVIADHFGMTVSFIFMGIATLIGTLPLVFIKISEELPSRS